VLLGGSNFVAVRFSNRELAPLFGAGARFALAAVVLVVWSLVARAALPRGRQLKVAVAYGVLTFTFGYALAYWALQELPAGIGAVVFGSTPLLTVLLAGAHGLERVTWRGIGAALLAVVGILILADPGGGGVPMVRLAAMVGGALAAAESGVLLKMVPATSPVATNGVAMAVGAGGLLVWSVLGGDAWTLPTESTTWVALLYLAVPGSVGLFALFLFVLERWTASAASYMAALFPVVAMIGGALVLDEAITTSGAIGAVVVLGAVYLGALRSEAGRAPKAVGRQSSVVPEEA
jgi:drug/metabolite transporter (DMT)-like permease